MLNKKKEKKERKKTGALKQWILQSLVEIKVTFDLLDTPTAPGVLQNFAVYSHLLYKEINYQTTITDDSCLLLVYRKKYSEVLIF